jgi:hypothetical protein
MARLPAAKGALAVFTAGILATMPSIAAGSYCEDLRRVSKLALEERHFAAITGAEIEGSFKATTLPLTGWQNCALYGANTYTCDSLAAPSMHVAAQAQATLVDEILSCFAGAWMHVLDRSSPGYAVLHPNKGAVSITLSLDEAADGQFVVRLSLFLRRG